MKLNLLISEGTRRIFDRHRSGSYAQNGEDLTLIKLLDHKRDGYYVDVGCNHPIRLSNTYALYLKGWQGLAIDGNRIFARQFATHRPRDIFVHAYVSDIERDAIFTTYKDQALSSLSREKIFDSPGQYKITHQHSVTTKRLDSILRENNTPNNFDVLSIDVENHDIECLHSIDLNEFFPKLIIIEAHGADVTKLGDHPICQHTSKYGYIPVAFQSANLFLFRK